MESITYKYLFGNYIWETKTSFRLRLNNHKSSIRNSIELPVSSDLIPLVIDQSPKSDLLFLAVSTGAINLEKLTKLSTVSKSNLTQNAQNRDIEFLCDYSSTDVS